MANFTQAANITERAISEAPVSPSEPFVMPPVNGELLIDYVTGVKPDAPFEYETVGGVDFQKRVMPNEASYRDNINKPYEANVLVRKFTKTQHDKLLDRIRASYKRIPYRRNPAYKSDGDEPEYLPAYDVCLGDWLVFVTPKEYLEMQLKSYIQEPTAPAHGELADLQGELYKAQAQVDKKKRG